MKLGELIKSKEYQDAKKRISAWRGRLEKGGQDEAVKVRDEKAPFFQQMRERRPDLYTAFQIDDKTLSEAIFKKLTGRDVILD
ncbi:MAG: hypothetical protein AB1529_06570 [Candidatus Micrarchaeota archaeon]